MDKNGLNEDTLSKYLSISLGVMSLLAIIGLLVNSRFETTEVLSSIINLTQVAIPVFVLIFTISLRNKSKSFLDVGTCALEKVQKKYPDRLQGPKYFRVNYDPEKGEGLKYLFFSYDSKSRGAKFVPVQNLEEGILAIYVQKNMLSWALGWGEGDNVQDEDIKKIQIEVEQAVTKLIVDKYKGFYEKLDDNSKNTAIIIDFDENKMGFNKYEKAVYECVETAYLAIIKHRQDKKK